MTFYDAVTYGGLLLIGVLLGRYGQQRWRGASRAVDRLVAEHRAERQQDSGLDIIPTPITALHSRRRPRDRWTLRRRVPEGTALELNLRANDEATERLADAHLPHYDIETFDRGAR